MAGAFPILAFVLRLAVSFAAAQTPFIVAIPDFPVAAPPVELPAWPWGENDWPTQTCFRLPQELRRVEAGLLEVKARYWAARMARGAVQGLPSSPGAEISDSGLRREFFSRLQARLLSRQFDPPPLGEIYRLRRSMRRQWSLIGRCGGDDEELRRAYEQIVP